MLSTQANAVGIAGCLPDVDVRMHDVPGILEGATARGVLWQAAPGRLLLHAPEVAGFLAEDGSRLTIDPAAGADAAQVGRFARMVPLAALAWQRGLLAFHASAALGPKGAVLLTGDSGAGKSTLLAALLGRGWKMLADDLSLVQLDERTGPHVLPASPEVALWPDALTRLALEPGVLGEPDRGPGGRCVVSVDGPLVAESQPLRAIYWLSTHNPGGVETAEVSGAERFRAVSALAYNSRIAAVLVDRGRHLATAASLARDVPVCRLRRPRGRWTVAELVDAVESGPSGA